MMMIQLLFLLILSEMAMILVLLFKTPFRKLLIVSLDRLKRGRQRPLVLKTVATTLVVLLLSGAYSIIHIQKRGIDELAPNPTDQILMANYLLQTTLVGAVLFLALMLDRLHHYIRELRIRRKTFEVIKLSVEVQALQEEKAKLRVELKQLKSDLESKTKRVDVAEASVIALRKQSEGFLLEYDRLNEENQNLRKQLKYLDRRLSHSVSKKIM